MTFAELNEAQAVLGLMLQALRGTLTGATGRQGAALLYAIGDLEVGAASALGAGAIGAALLNCFDLAVQAGATFDQMDAVRLAMQAQVPTGLPALIVATLGVRLALSKAAKILAVTTFASQQDAQAAITAIDAAFDAAEEFAADHRNPAVYQALLGLHASVIRDLTTRARPLPKLVAYTTPMVVTAHALANRLYGDVGRADELRAENKTIHPAFMQRDGVALSE